MICPEPARSPAADSIRGWDVKYIVVGKKLWHGLMVSARSRSDRVLTARRAQARDLPASLPATDVEAFPFFGSVLFLGWCIVAFLQTFRHEPGLEHDARLRMQRCQKGQAPQPTAPPFG